MSWYTLPRYKTSHFYLFTAGFRRVSLLLSLSQPRRRRQRERHQTKGVMSKTIAVHVRYIKSLNISLPSSAKQQRQRTKFCFETWTRTANFSATMCPRLPGPLSSLIGTLRIYDGDGEDDAY